MILEVSIKSLSLDFINFKIQVALNEWLPNDRSIKALRTHFIPREEHKLFNNELSYFKIRLEAFDIFSKETETDIKELRAALTSKTDYVEFDRRVEDLENELKTLNTSLLKYTPYKEFYALKNTVCENKNSIEFLK